MHQKAAKNLALFLTGEVDNSTACLINFAKKPGFFVITMQERLG